MNVTEVKVFKQPGLTDSVIQQIIRLKMQSWKYPCDSQLRWLRTETEASDLHLALFASSQMIAYLRLALRTLTTGRNRRDILGVGTVCVDEMHRGRGVGCELMEAANHIIVEEAVDAGLLNCQAPVIGFYEKCGWRLLETRFVKMSDSRAEYFADENVMAYPPDFEVGEAASLDGKPF